MLFSKCPHNVECAKHRENEGQSFGKCWTGFWAAPSRLSFLTSAAHDLGWEVHRPVCIFLGPSCIDRRMDLPSEVLFLAAQFMYFFEENTEVLIFYIRIGTPGPTYVSLLPILYIFKLFYMLLYIIFIVIIYLTDTYICKKTISRILLTYKNNFLTIKSWIFLATKSL